MSRPPTSSTVSSSPSPRPSHHPPATVLHGSAELVAALPHLLGFPPTRSLVVLATAPSEGTGPGAGRPVEGRGARADEPPTRGRLVATLRADLPAPGATGPLVGELLAMLARHGRLLLHAFLVDADDALAAELSQVLATAAPAHGLVLHDLAQVDGPGHRCRPLGGSDGWVPGPWRPVPAPADVPAVADLVLEGRGVLASRQELVDRIRERDPGATTSFERELRALEGGDPLGHLDPGAALRALGTLVLRGTRPTPAQLVPLAVLLHDRDLRDGVLARWLPELFPVDLLEPEVARLVEDALPGWPGRSHPALDRLVGLLPAVPEDLQVPLLTVCAALAWGHGEGALANVCTERALEVDPDYRMAQLIDQALTHGVDPRLLGGRGAGAA